MASQITTTHEQTADLPVIIADLKQMRVAELLDKHFPTNGNWSGLSLRGDGCLADFHHLRVEPPALARRAVGTGQPTDLASVSRQTGRAARLQRCSIGDRARLFARGRTLDRL